KEGGFESPLRKRRSVGVFRAWDCTALTGCTETRKRDQTAIEKQKHPIPSKRNWVLFLFSTYEIVGGYIIKITQFY
ncbi:MAG: hypothetical protein IJP14_02665, partial [Clostridia bacterium]|nr:hypothetical protein [Clostridia bacterium]